MKNLLFCCIFFALALPAQPTLQWQKAFGGSDFDEASSILQTSDGGYIVAGDIVSNDGDVFGNHGGDDFWVLKLNNTGLIQWKKALGGSNNDIPYSIQQTNDAGFIVAGFTESNNGDVSGNHGSNDAWVVKLSSTGVVEWQKTFGGTSAEACFSFKQTVDNGYILGGYAWSNDGDVSGVQGYNDFWVVKLSPESSGTSDSQVQPIEIYPNPAISTITLQFDSLSVEVSTEAEESPFSVRITDLLGRELSRQTVSTGEQIDIAALPNGLYLLTATTSSGKTFSGKLRKE